MIAIVCIELRFYCCSKGREPTVTSSIDDPIDLAHFDTAHLIPMLLRERERKKKERSSGLGHVLHLQPTQSTSFVSTPQTGFWRWAVRKPAECVLLDRRVKTFVPVALGFFERARNKNVCGDDSRLARS